MSRDLGLANLMFHRHPYFGGRQGRIYAGETSGHRRDLSHPANGPIDATSPEEPDVRFEREGGDVLAAGRLLEVLDKIESTQTEMARALARNQSAPGEGPPVRHRFFGKNRPMVSDRATIRLTPSQLTIESNRGWVRVLPVQSVGSIGLGRTSLSISRWMTATAFACLGLSLPVAFFSTLLAVILAQYALIAFPVISAASRLRSKIGLTVVDLAGTTYFFKGPGFSSLRKVVEEMSTVLYGTKNALPSDSYYEIQIDRFGVIGHVVLGGEAVRRSEGANPTMRPPPPTVSPAPRRGPDQFG